MHYSSGGTTVGPRPQNGRSFVPFPMHSEWASPLAMWKRVSAPPISIEGKNNPQTEERARRYLLRDRQTFLLEKETKLPTQPHDAYILTCTKRLTNLVWDNLLPQVPAGRWEKRKALISIFLTNTPICEGRYCSFLAPRYTKRTTQQCTNVFYLHSWVHVVLLNRHELIIRINK